MPIIYIASGSNLGDRLVNLQNAIATLPPAVLPLEVSPVYETEPWGYTDQPLFLNQVIKAETNLNPQDLLAYLKSAEVSLGRQPTFKNGPRLIDLDLLFYDDLVYEGQNLRIPHPHLQERAFVLVPLVDLAPELRHPILTSSIRELVERIDISGVKPYSREEAI
jgi:2-amino-4-hydroxy-6-hydroxymethyldihydropteridine diphosphokinase